MQLICRNTVTDRDAWQSAFEDDREAQSQAGLSLLQLWHDADDANTVWFLFDVNDRAKAQAFMEDGQAKMHADRAGVTSGEYHFVETA